jgi:hemoglobin
MPAERAFRSAVREHIEFGSRVALQNSNATSDEELHPLREVPRWTWAGDETAPSAVGAEGLEPPATGL